MTLLYILTILLLCIALAYLFKVIDLSRALKSEKEWVPSENDNRTMGKFFLLFMFLFIAWSFYQVYQYGYRSLPKSASEHGDKVDELMRYNMYIIWVVFVLTNFVLFYFAWKYYGRKNGKAEFFAHDNKLEMIWTVVPAIVLAFIIIFGLKYWNEIMEKSTDTKSVKIELYSKQFDWTARYAGADNTFGLDGVQNKIHPGEAADKNLYDLPPEEDAKIPTVCHSLDQALECLDKDREFLTRGGVFTNSMLDAYIDLKMEEVTKFRMTTHPIEFDMYYSL